MRPFLSFVSMLALALVCSAALTYPAWLLVMNFDVQPVHRVMHRLAQLFALVGLLVMLRKMRLSNRATLGYDMPRGQFLRQLAVGFVAGALIMLPLVASLYGLDLRDTRSDWQAGRIYAAIGSGLATGFAVALIEETFFRGAMYSAIQRTSGALVAAVLTSVLYAALHFIGGRLRVAPEDVTWRSGFDVLLKLFEKYAEPLALFDSFVALFAVGMLLSLVRARTRAIAACMGLHAAWVCVIVTLRKVSVVNDEASHGWLVGSYDGVIGWLALAWIAVFMGLYWIYGRRSGAT